MRAGKINGPASSFRSIEKAYGQPIGHGTSSSGAQSARKHMDTVNRLEAEHGLGHGHAKSLVTHTLCERAG